MPHRTPLTVTGTLYAVVVSGEYSTECLTPIHLEITADAAHLLIGDQVVRFEHRGEVRQLRSAYEALYRPPAGPSRPLKRGSRVVPLHGRRSA